MKVLTTLALASVAAATLMSTRPQDKQTEKDDSMRLGNFSVSLAVKDIKASKAFYEKLDFKQVSGKLEQNWVVLKNGTTKIGLFQGMFEKNSLTFNPGWDHERKTPEDFQDVRELQRILKQRGIKLQTEADESTDGPANFTLVDPDGNPILVDQHVPKPKR
jgi:catechol 2,3-dioxygenase-like lactoylglutathione lyase family enzyme